MLASIDPLSSCWPKFVFGPFSTNTRTLFHSWFFKRWSAPIISPSYVNKEFDLTSHPCVGKLLTTICVKWNTTSQTCYLPIVNSLCAFTILFKFKVVLVLNSYHKYEKLLCMKSFIDLVNTKNCALSDIKLC